MTGFDFYVMVVSFSMSLSIILTCAYFLYHHYRDSTNIERYWRSMYRGQVNKNKKLEKQLKECNESKSE